VHKIAFGGGCHWCTEAIFDTLKGVQKVEQGWISSSILGATTPSEAVIVHFDTTKIPLDILIEVHLLTHNSTSNHTFRQKYRSAIYTFNKIQNKKATNILKDMQMYFDKPLITKVYPFESFKLNQEKYLNYYKKDPSKPFCKTRIEPKLKMILEKFTKYAKL